MTELDLLPSEYRPKGPVNLHNLSLIVLSLGLAFALLTITISLIGRSQGYTTLLNDLQVQMIPYKKQYEDIQVAQEKLKTLEERLPLIQSLISRRILWSRRLNDLNQTLPEDGIWLEKLTVLLPQQEQESTSSTAQDAMEPSISEMPWLKVSGWAKDVADISDLMRAVGAVPGFQPPVLLTAQDNEIEGRELIAFEFEVRLTDASGS